MQKEIDRNDWPRWFEEFTKQHDHWLVSVDGERDTMPLEGIVARDSRITITLGGDIQHHRRIVIDGARVTVDQRGGGDEAVEIESSDGHRTNLRLRAPSSSMGPP